jgi:multiple sugar transport system permease protein
LGARAATKAITGTARTTIGLEMTESRQSQGVVGPVDSGHRAPQEVKSRWARARASVGLGREGMSLLVDRHVVIAFTGPTLLFLLIMMVFPLSYAGYLSLNEWTGSAVLAPESVGLQNYAKLVSDTRFWSATGTTLLFTVAAVSAQVGFGTAIALLINRNFIGQRVVRGLIFLPVMATPVAVGLVWRLLFNPSLGLLNQILAVFGIPASEWTANPRIALSLLVLVDTWQWTPLIVLIVLAGLLALPVETMEAALVDGASSFQRLRYVVLPMIRPIIFVAAAFRVVDALRTFDIIYVITDGGPNRATETLNIYAYKLSFQFQQFGYASAVLVAFFAIIMIVVSILLSFRRARGDR